MTKTKTCPNHNTIQKDGPPRKTQFIKFRVTPEEKRDLEIMCEILHVNMSTLLRRCLRTKPIKQNPETFREQHRAELTAYQAAAAYFKAQKITKLPSLKQLEAEREHLISEKARFYEAYREAKKAWIELSTAQQNLLSTLHREDRQQIQEGGLHDTDIAH